MSTDFFSSSVKAQELEMASLHGSEILKQMAPTYLFDSDVFNRDADLVSFGDSICAYVRMLKPDLQDTPESRKSSAELSAIVAKLWHQSYDDPDLDIALGLLKAVSIFSGLDESHGISCLALAFINEFPNTDEIADTFFKILQRLQARYRHGPSLKDTHQLWFCLMHFVQTQEDIHCLMICNALRQRGLYMHVVNFLLCRYHHPVETEADLKGFQNDFNPCLRILLFGLTLSLSGSWDCFSVLNKKTLRMLLTTRKWDVASRDAMEEELSSVVLRIGIHFHRKTFYDVAFGWFRCIILKYGHEGGRPWRVFLTLFLPNLIMNHIYAYGYEIVHVYCSNVSRLSSAIHIQVLMWFFVSRLAKSILHRRG